jgi:hypothetical protein
MSTSPRSDSFPSGLTAGVKDTIAVEAALTAHAGRFGRGAESRDLVRHGLGRLQRKATS